MTKILLITGLHGSEQYTQTIVDELLSKNKFMGFDFMSMQITHFHRISETNTRELILNMNNISDINNLVRETRQMSELLELIENADIVLDLHNSTNCEPLALVSLENDGYLEKYNEYFSLGNFSSTAPIYWRYGKVQTISEYCRRKGKLSFTIEFGGMFFDIFDSNRINKLDKDVRFLNTFMKDCFNFCRTKKVQKDFYDDRNIRPMPYKLELLNQWNRLRSGKFPKNLLPIVGPTYLESLDDDRNIELGSLFRENDEDVDYSNCNDNYNYGIKILSFENNYCQDIEYVIYRTQKSKNIVKNLFNTVINCNQKNKETK